MMKTKHRAFLFLLFGTVMAGCSSLDPDFYHPTETYPGKLPLTVGVKVAPITIQGLTDVGKDRLKAAALKSLASVFEKADFVSQLSRYDVLANVDVSLQPHGGGSSALNPPVFQAALSVQLKNQKDGQFVGIYRSASPIPPISGGDYAIAAVSGLLLCIPCPFTMPYLMDESTKSAEAVFSKNLDQVASKIYHDRKQLLASLNGSDQNAALLARIQRLKTRLQELKSGEQPSPSSSEMTPSPGPQNDQSQVLSEIKALQSQISALKPKAKVSIRSDVDSPSFEDPKDPRDFALVIGVEHYSQGIPKADYADRDAQAVFGHLVALGVPPRHIQRLTDATATRGRIRAALHWLYRNVKPGGTVYVYYSGHGSPGQSGNAYLVPADGDPSNLPETGISISSLYQSLNKLPARHVIVAMDACFTGQGKRSVLGKGARPLVTKVREGAFPASGKLIAFSAAKSDQESGVLESQGHGLFTYYFLKGLDKGAVKDGHVTVEALYRYLKPKVADEAGIDNRNQTPEIEPRTLGPDALVRLR